jgi:diguanylate cyclase (GGDEF)-like protein/PAS domain S-box-containing protein
MAHPAIEPSARLWARPDFQSLAFGRRGEVLAAKVRLGVMALVALIPLESVLLRPPDPEARIGLGAAIAVFALGILVLRLAQRATPPPWLGLFTCLLDISTVSLINAGFVLAGKPLAATNSRVVFCCYFVALAMVCLRQDRRWCLVATLAALMEYGGIVLWAARRYDLHGPAFEHGGYGTFNWDNQVGRLILLAVAGAIGTVIVVQGRGYWGAVIRYLDAFPLGVLITGPDGKSQYANPAARQLLGRAIPPGTDVSELDAQSFLAASDQLYPPERGAIARALSGESTAGDELEIQRPDARIAVAVWGTPILDPRSRVANAIAVFHDETRRRRAEEELRRTSASLAASEARARALLETAPDAMVIVDRGGRIVLVNTQSERLFGYPRAELIGQPVEMLVPEPLREAHAGHRSRFVAAASTRPMGAELDLYARRKDGSVFPVEVSLSPLQTEGGLLVSGAIRDVTERRRLAAAVAASEERYRALFEKSLGLLCTHALDGKLLTVNAAAAAALGRSPDQMVGHNLAELLAPAVRGTLADYLAAIAAAGEMSGTMVLLDDSGGERVWQYRNHLVREPHQEPYVVGHALDVTNRTRLERVLREQALTDPLTGLPNRALFEDRLRRALERARREAGADGELPPLALAYLDLDGFKDVNDRFGHAAGDAVLREVGSRLREGVRTLDTVARLGGDEFALILPDIGSVANARRLIEKLVDSLRRPFTHAGAALAVSVSLGVSMLPRDGESAESLTARADEAMYAAKAAGRNGYRFFGDTGEAEALGPGGGALTPSG